MSSKGHLVLNNDLEIFEETNESFYSFGKFQGYNIYFIASNKCIDKIKLDGIFLFIYFKKDTEAHKYLGGQILRITLDSIKEIEFEFDEFCFCIKGDHYINMDISSQNWKKFLI